MFNLPTTQCDASVGGIGPRRLLSRVLLFLAAITVVAAVSCSGGAPTPTPTFSGGPFPTFPYVFHGAFTVNGQPGRAGTPIFARVGNTHSPEAAAPADGQYNNIVIGPGPGYEDDIGKQVKFYIGTLDGTSVEANESFTFRVVGQVTNIQLDLSFPNYP